MFTLNPGKVTLMQLKNAIEKKQKCRIPTEDFLKITQAQQMVDKIVEKQQIVYGINTGFGAMASQVISPQDLKQLQLNLLRSHACGTGELLSDEIVSLILLLKINGLSQGYSGIRPVVIEHLIALYNAQIFPCIPARGSVGASGDLAPLAHLALPLIGEGEVRCESNIITAAEGLKIAGLVPLELMPKEGLALINGLQVSTALTIHALLKAQTLFESAVIVGSLSVDAARASDVPFDDRIQQVRGHASQREVAALYRKLLQGSEIRESHRNCSRVQDPYSLRCQPQIMGAVLHQLNFVNDTLAVEANAVSDNPLLFVEQSEVLSGGNFHGQMIAMAADNLALAIAEIGSNAERRIALLIDKNFSGLPPFLTKESGLHSGFMIPHVTAAACASQNKALAFPNSVDTIPTSANQEDHVSMATGAAWRLQTMLDNTATILAIELLAACQGIEFLAPLKTSPFLLNIYEKVRASVDSYQRDRYFAPEIAKIKKQLLAGNYKVEHFR